MNAFRDIDSLLRVISREKDILKFLFTSRKLPSLRREQALDPRKLEEALEAFSQPVSRAVQVQLTGDSKTVAKRSCPGFPVNVVAPLSVRLGDRASFFVPEDIAERLEQSGSRERYDSQFERFGRMEVADVRVQPLVSLIHRYHKGYDQEGYICI